MNCSWMSTFGNYILKYAYSKAEVVNTEKGGTACYFKIILAIFI